MDALWKPIIRKFRKFVKLRVMHTLRYDVDENQSITVLGRQFGEILGVSKELLDQEPVCMALYVLIHSQSLTHVRDIPDDLKEKLGSHCKKIKQNYFTIFFENSRAKRVVFFAQPLIQELWNIYRSEC